MTPDSEWVNPVKQKLLAGQAVLGGTITLANLDSAAVMANAGFDFLWIEGEHSPVTLETTRNIVLATRGLKAIPFTRVPVNELWTAKRMLDAGSLGVMFPFTSTVELARQAVAACKYPPQGLRGAGWNLAELRWPVPGGYTNWANDNVVVVVIIEQKGAVDQIEEIAAVPGIDVLFIGFGDLSFSYGVPGDWTASVIQKAADRVLQAAHRNKVAVGAPAGNPAQIVDLMSRGFQFIQGPTDLGLLQSAAADLFAGLAARQMERKAAVPIGEDGL